MYSKEFQAMAGGAFHAGDYQEGNFWLALKISPFSCTKNKITCFFYNDHFYDISLINIAANSKQIFYIEEKASENKSESHECI